MFEGEASYGNRNWKDQKAHPLSSLPTLASLQQDPSCSEAYLGSHETRMDDYHCFPGAMDVDEVSKLKEGTVRRAGLCSAVGDCFRDCFMDSGGGFLFSSGSNLTSLGFNCFQSSQYSSPPQQKPLLPPSASTGSVSTGEDDLFAASALLDLFDASAINSSASVSLLFDIQETFLCLPLTGLLFVAVLGLRRRQTRNVPRLLFSLGSVFIVCEDY